jgi:DNA-directed RNA polymerase specialized sigma subunit
MGINDIKLYLNQAFFLDKQINSLIKVKEENISLAQRCTANYNNDGGSNPTKTNTQENIYIKIADQSKQIDQQIDKLVDIRNEIERLINTVTDTDGQSILRMRYLAYMPMTDIADIMGCDRRTIYRKYNKSIEELVEREKMSKQKNKG